MNKEITKKRVNKNTGVKADTTEVKKVETVENLEPNKSAKKHRPRKRKQVIKKESITDANVNADIITSDDIVEETVKILGEGLYLEIEKEEKPVTIVNKKRNWFKRLFGIK